MWSQLPRHGGSYTAVPCCTIWNGSKHWGFVVNLMFILYYINWCRNLSISSMSKNFGYEIESVFCFPKTHVLMYVYFFFRWHVRQPATIQAESMKPVTWDPHPTLQPAPHGCSVVVVSMHCNASRGCPGAQKLQDLDVLACPRDRWFFKVQTSSWMDQC